MRGASREFTFGVFSSSPLGWSRLALVKSSWGRGVPGVFLERVKNLGSRTVAFGYGCSKSVPKRCLRRRVGVLGAPYLALLREEAPQRERTICARSSTGSEVDREHRDSPWRYMPHDLPRWEALYKQRWRWIRAGLFEEMVHDLRVLLRLSAGRAFDPTATALDLRTLRRTPESGSRGGYGEHKPKKGSKVHAAVDTWGHLLALRVSRANEDDRKEVGKLFGGDPGSHPKETSRAGLVRRSGLHRRASGRSGPLTRHQLASSKTRGGRARLPRALAEETGGGSRFRVGIALPRRLVKDYERLPETVAGLHLASLLLATLFCRRGAFLAQVHNTL
jgi:hypothetical protein